MLSREKKMHFLGLIKLNFNSTEPKNSLAAGQNRTQQINITEEQKQLNLARIEEALCADDNQGICNLTLYL
jgi:hypothetical protein